MLPETAPDSFTSLVRGYVAGNKESTLPELLQFPARGKGTSQKLRGTPGYIDNDYAPKKSIGAVMTSVEPAQPSPLFIVGSPRSGTTVLVDAALACGFHGFREGNLLGLLQPLYDRIHDYFRRPETANAKTVVAHVRRDALKTTVRDAFKAELERLNEQHPWLDKTCNAETILVVPDLVQMWPNCRIIFARRRAIENIQSRLKKFPERDFHYHCRDWTRNMWAWRRVREGLEAWRYLEVDQHDVVVQPQNVAQGIASLLRLDAKARARMESAFRNLRPQQTAPGTAERVIPLNETSWTPAQIAKFIEICGTEMEAYGYSMDGTYCKAAPTGFANRPSRRRFDRYRRRENSVEEAR
jgi:hypothetical protein